PSNEFSALLERADVLLAQRARDIVLQPRQHAARVEGVPAVEDDQLLVLPELAQADAALGAVVACFNQGLALHVRRNGRAVDAATGRLALLEVPDPRQALDGGRGRASATRLQLEL